MNEIPSSIDTLIVGAGISGLACALECQKNDKQFLLVEETERVGGKVGSMKEDGFIFDLGFQVYNTAYEATNSLLNLEKIDLNHFRPGAMVHDGNSFQMIADPLRDLGQAFGTLFSDISTIGDKLKVLKLKNSLRGYRIELDNEEDKSTNEFLLDQGFSERMIEMFFRPFFSGIFLENKLETSSKFFKYVFSMFNTGLASLPERGMQAIPDDLLEKIDKQNVFLGKKVVGLEGQKDILFDDGHSLKVEKLVLTGGSTDLTTRSIHEYNAVKTLYFSSKFKPENGEYIHLYPCDDLMNNIAIPTCVSGSYSESGDHLISVTIIENDLPEIDLINNVQKRLRTYYGGGESDYQFLKYIEIKEGTLCQRVGHFDKPKHEQDNIFIIGEQGTNGSIEGAVLSGLNVANFI